MQTIILRPQPLTAGVLKLLERRSLIRRLQPSPRLRRDRSPNGAMETLYYSHPRFGSHKLICVKKNNTAIRLNCHPAGEEFILIHDAHAVCKPLYILIGLHSHEALKRKAQRGKLSSRDFLLLRVRFNDPGTCIFTMCAGTPHCEFTAPGTRSGPIFFVSEPSRLHMKAVKLSGYRFSCASSAARLRST